MGLFITIFILIFIILTTLKIYLEEKNKYKNKKDESIVIKSEDKNNDFSFHEELHNLAKFELEQTNKRLTKTKTTKNKTKKSKLKKIE